MVFWSFVPEYPLSWWQFVYHAHWKKYIEIITRSPVGRVHSCQLFQMTALFYMCICVKKNFYTEVPTTATCPHWLIQAKLSSQLSMKWTFLLGYIFREGSFIGGKGQSAKCVQTGGEGTNRFFHVSRQNAGWWSCSSSTVLCRARTHTQAWN